MSRNVIFVLMCHCHKLLDLNYTEIFYITIDENIASTQCNMSFGGPTTMRKVDGLSLILSDFYVPALTPCLNSMETSL
jgi:hypothetical protein